MSRKTRKLIWSAPLVAVLAVAGALAIFMTLQPNSALAQAEEIPGMPMKPMAKALGPSSIELMWEAPTTGGTPDGYRIDYSDDGKVWYSLEPNHDSTVFTDDKDLMAVQMRHYRIFAFNSGGSSSVLSGISATTDKSMKADAPTNILVAAGDGAGTPDMTQTQITVTWTAPEDPDGAPVKMYKIEVSKDGRSFSKLAEQTPMQAMCPGTDNSCTYTHKNLLEMQERWYRVSAINYPNGMGASAVESSASVAKSDETAVGAIPPVSQNLRAGLNPAGRIWLYWDEPELDSDGDGVDDLLPGAPIVGYYIHGGPAAVTDGHMVSKLHFVEASTSLALTTSVLNKFDKPDFDGPDDDLSTEGDNESWMFNVTAVNSVVRRNLENGMAATADATFTPVLEVDNAKDTTPDATTDDLLNRPTLTVNRINDVNAGRTNITVKWKVEKLASDNTDKVYRIERSEDRIDWENITPGTSPPIGQTMTMIDMDRTAGTTYYYRVFAAHNKAGLVDVYTEASLTTSVTTAPAGKPNAPMSPSATAASETQIDVAWTAPGMNGSPEVGHGKVTGYEIDVSDDGKTWSLLTTVAGDKMAYEHKGLVQGQTKYYRVSTINNAPGSARRSVPTDAVSATTLTSFASDSPGGLVAKAMGRTAIELLWNARAFDITAAPIIGYKIESSPLNAMGNCAEDWTVLMADTMGTTTAYTHSGLAAATGRCYRVFGINIVATSSTFVGHGDQYVVTNDNDAKATTDPAVVPGMPMNVMADATSDTEIKVTWESPSDNGGADITGYVVESAYMKADDTMSDWMAVDPAHEGMEMMYMDTSLMPMTKYYYRVSAMNSVGTGMPSDGMASDTTDTSNTAPADGPDLTATVTAGETTTVQSTISDPDTGDTLTWNTVASSTDATKATATVDDTTGMVTITGVAAGTATITVTAMDVAGASATQDIVVTVTAANMDPMPATDPGDVLPTSVDLIVGGDDEVLTLTDSFTDADGDTLTYTAMSDMEMYATATVSDDGTMLTIAAVAAGAATVTVTADDGNGGTATHEISVTVTAPLMAPTIKSTNPVGSGIVLVSWDAVVGATGYSLIATNLSDPSAPTRTAAADADDKSGQIQNLTPGDEYLIFVGAFNDDLEFALSKYVRLTVDR